MSSSINRYREKEKADVDQLERPDVKKFLVEQGKLDARMSKEQEEYLEALQKKVPWESLTEETMSAG